MTCKPSFCSICRALTIFSERLTTDELAHPKFSGGSILDIVAAISQQSSFQPKSAELSVNHGSQRRPFQLIISFVVVYPLAAATSSYPK